MAKRKKSSKDKRKKKKLTNKELLKIIKAIKPQNQQIVRVNVGDDRKKKGEVVPSINPPFVFPSGGFPAITYAQPKAPVEPTPSIVAPSWNVSNVSSQPQLQPLIMPPSSSGVTFREAPLLLTDVEQTDVENIKVRPARRSRKKEEEAMQGYSVKEPPEPRFKPRMTRTSQLAEQASQTFKIREDPSDNDPFMPVTIQTTSDADQVGNLSAPADSSQWVLTPEGNEPPLEEMTQNQQTESFIDSGPVDVFGEPIMPPMPPSEEEQMQEENIVVEPTKEEIKKAKRIKEIKSETVASFLKPKKGQMIDDLNSGIANGEVDLNSIPKAWLVTKGAQKGKIRDSVKVSDLQPFWDELYTKRGGLLMGSK